MSDVFGGPSGAPSSRVQNGGPRPAQPAGQTPTDPPRYRTPTDVMRDRRLREARRAEQEAQRQREEEQARRRQQEEAAGVEGEQTRRPLGTRPEAHPGQGYTIAGPSSQPTTSGRRQENIPPIGQAQTQPSSAQQQTGAGLGHARLSSNTQRNRTQAYEKLSIPAPSNPAQQPSARAPQPSAPAATQQPRAAFPHAFERWETLSSHWEGLTSFWIRRLQENTNELNGKPIDQQMSRQITDLSAAGANLFHALIELQRLRASSERKFTRWFFETKHEQEQTSERIAELERQLRAERENRQQTAAVEAVRLEKAKADEVVREMRRELQISKEEARRAWEELGRREQEERERTIALRSGEPTLIGGVQVVPMQGISSRQTSSAHRPRTRDGPYPGGPTTTVMGGQVPPQNPPSRSQTTTTSLDSPGEEHRQFTYQPHDTSPTSTDPFTETAGAQQSLRHEPDTQFYQSQPTPRTQPPSSAAAIAASVAASQHAQPAVTNGHSTSTRPGQFYQQPSPQTTIHQPLTSAGMPTVPASSAPPRSGTAQSLGTLSYIPSTAGSEAEEEYHINPDGTFTRDSQGRRIPYTQPIVSSPDPNLPEGSVGEISEEDDYTSDIAREREYARQYGTSARPTASPGIAGLPSQQPRTHPQAQPGDIPRTTSGQLPPLPTIPQGQVSQTPPAPQPPTTDYEGTSYGPGWEGVTPRHRHPTRLSDILEEQTSRTSPSRTSFVSGGGGAGAGGDTSRGGR